MKGKKNRGVVTLERKEGCMLIGLGIRVFLTTDGIGTTLNLEQSQKAA